MTTSDAWIQARRLGGLRRFAIAITVLNVLGHTILGFEQSFAQPLLALATAYSCELFAEWIEARVDRRRPRFLEGWRQTIDFLLPAHITGLAVAMLLYSGDSVLPTMFAAAVAIASKATVRVCVQGRMRHFLNPSNFGITITLLVFPWVGVAPPYQFTEGLGPAGSLVLPAILCITGTIINLRFTGRVPLILSWWAGFVIQATVRSVLLGTPLAGSLNPMTGVAFLLFSFYMISDPATTPFSARNQVLFGFSVAAVYGVLIWWHVAFHLFFALTAVAILRGVGQYIVAHARATTAVETAEPVAEHAPSRVVVMRRQAP